MDSGWVGEHVTFGWVVVVWVGGFDDGVGGLGMGDKGWIIFFFLVVLIVWLFVCLVV